MSRNASSPSNLGLTPNSNGNTAGLMDKDSEKYCWVCFATEEEDREAAWVKPCKCRGTTKWVHQSCLQRWVDEKQKGGNMGKVLCPQCQTEYIIIFPNMGTVVHILDATDKFINQSCPFIAAGIVVTGLYWCSVTYGAITVMQVIGQKEALAIMGEADPLILLVGLPAIPIALVMGKLIRWEEAVLYFMRKFFNKIPLIRRIPLFRIDIERTTLPASSLENNLPPISINGPISTTRVLCGALILPTIASVIGKNLFDSIKSNFHKTLLGGLVFITFKGCLKIFHKHQNYIKRCYRQILDYTESNISAYVRDNSENR
ncbi:unnamed protein product [Ceutorhynchus assimilis]|uniref:E3 ubiquitin-protein ligase MARCHF5 n=1 Tax=Ceutorhynchus assimilis TaxID=467358 RepID=A0A9N9MIR7_9CUCU|nr:unnamed protein product [Ceutorhynchus assimilis]